VLLAALSWSGTFPQETLPALLTLAVFGSVGLTVYLVIATWLGLEEPRILARTVQQKLVRLRPHRGSLS
jgi:hypothetical protein